MPLTYVCPTCEKPCGSYAEYLEHEVSHPRDRRVGLLRPEVQFVSQVDAQQVNRG